MSSLALGPTRPPFQWVPGFLRGLMRLACDVNHSPQSGAKVKNEWISTFLLFLWLRSARRISTSLVAILYPSLSCTTCLQVTIAITLLSFSASSFPLALGLTLGCFWCTLAWYMFLVFLPSSIPCRCLKCRFLHRSEIAFSLLWCKSYI